MKKFSSRHFFLDSANQVLMILLLGGTMAACTSKRKISNVGVRDPRSVVSENRQNVIEASEITAIRKKALETSPPRGCSAKLTKYINKLSLTHLPEPECPDGFEARVVEAMQAVDFTSGDGFLFESLRKVSCKGKALLSRTDDQYSIAEAVTSYLNRRPNVPRPSINSGIQERDLEREPSSKREQRILERERQEKEELAALEQKKKELRDELIEDLRIINDRNIAVQRRIASAGSYLLTEENLRFIMSLLDNGCRVKSIQNYFARDNASLTAMEQTESLIIDPSLKREFGTLRLMVQGILDEYIKSFF